MVRQGSAALGIHFAFSSLGLEAAMELSRLGILDASFLDASANVTLLLTEVCSRFETPR